MSELSTAFTRLGWCWLELVGSDPAITPFTFRVAFALSSFCNHASGLAWPKHEKIAELVAGTRGGVKSAIRNLINAGYLVCDEAHGRYATNTYAMARPENGHGRDRLFPANRPPATENGHGHDENGHDHRKNGHGHDEKGSQPSPQNTTKNSSMNSVMNSDRSLRSRDKNTSNLESAKKKQPAEKQAPKVRTDRGRIELEIAAIAGWDRLYELSPVELNNLCDEWVGGRIPRAALLDDLMSNRYRGGYGLPPNRILGS